MQKEIKHTFYFTQAPEEVWEYLTRPELMEQWLMPSDFQPIPGHHFRFTNPNNTFVICEVLEVKPFTNLSYVWKNDWSKTKTPYTSKVSWTLTPIENGTELLFALSCCWFCFWWSRLLLPIRPTVSDSKNRTKAPLRARHR